MIKAKILWTPFPFKAGFCITDDTDAATFEQIKTVYDFLLSKKFLTTKTVWAFNPSEKCGIPPTPDSTLRGVTLQNNLYLEYCKMLQNNGYEICLHGASAGNNSRESTKNAMEFLAKEIGRSDTFICHSKNAENIFWNDKITAIFPINYLLKLISNYKCSGEHLESPYFWGDICREKINQIRLFRTRSINTLKSNPSMPFYSPEKFYVNGWFSATKRAIYDCTEKSVFEKLIAENGLTVLYQYLHRYAQTKDGSLNKKFTDAIESISANSSIWVDTVSNIMKRLRLMQGVFLFYEKNYVWLLNTNNCSIDSFQMSINKNFFMQSDKVKIKITDNIVNISDIPPASIIKIEINQNIKIYGQRCYFINKNRFIFRKCSSWKLFVNLSETDWWTKEGILIKPNSFHLDAKKSGTNLSLLSFLSFKEEILLILGQLWIVIREILFKGRSINTSKYLDDSKEIKLENHDNW